MSSSIAQDGTEEEVPPPADETSLDSLLEVLLHDEELSDVTLQGSDGVIVPSTRSILAARSKVFRAMLYGKFKESTEEVVEIGFPGPILRAVVEYCFTDKPEMLLKEDASNFDDQDAKYLAELMDAAAFFHLPGLRLKSEKLAEAVMKQKPCMSLVFLDESTRVGTSLTRLGECAMNTIRAKAIDLADADELLDIHNLTLETILKDPKIEAEEVSLFLMLKKWAEADSGESEASSRREIATELMANINISDISASDLDSIVEPSGLASPDVLQTVYKRRLLAFEAQPGVPRVKKLRYKSLPCWKSSKIQTLTFSDNRVELLKCPPMTSGVYRWKILVEKLDGGAGFLGVKSCSGRAGVLHGSTGTTWTQGKSFSSGGWEQCGNNSLPFIAGSEATFTLDLRANGIFWVSIDGGDACEIFSEIRPLLFVDGQIDLVPCANFKHDGDRIRLLEFESIDQDD